MIERCLSAGQKAARPAAAGQPAMQQLPKREPLEILVGSTAWVSWGL